MTPHPAPRANSPPLQMLPCPRIDTRARQVSAHEHENMNMNVSMNIMVQDRQVRATVSASPRRRPSAVQAPPWQLADLAMPIDVNRYVQPWRDAAAPPLCSCVMAYQKASTEALLVGAANRLLKGRLSSKVRLLVWVVTPAAPGWLRLLRWQRRDAATLHGRVRPARLGRCDSGTRRCSTTSG